MRVFAWNGTAWQPHGSHIDGEGDNHRLGHNVALSADAHVLVTGAPLSSTYSGHLRAFAWNGSDWVPRGKDIIGEELNGRCGWSSALSHDGSVLAVGCRNNNNGGQNSGEVRVYAWNGSDWHPRVALPGSNNQDWSGDSVALSADGNKVAIGAPQNDGEDAHNSNRGQVRLYTWNGTAWGDPVVELIGEEGGRLSSVALSSDGSVLAAGAPGSGAGQVRVYHGSTSVRYHKANLLSANITLPIVGASVAQSGYAVPVYINGDTMVYMIEKTPILRSGAVYKEGWSLVSRSGGFIDYACLLYTSPSPRDS